MTTAERKKNILQLELPSPSQAAKQKNAWPSLQSTDSQNEIVAAETSIKSLSNHSVEEQQSDKQSVKSAKSRRLSVSRES